MTTLRDGTVVDESIDAVHVTRAADVPYVFKCGPRVVDSITGHHWGAFGQNFDEVVGYLTSDNPRQSSAHAVIMAGRATSIVNPDDAAWHAGSAIGNTTSVGLELHPEATDEDYVTAAAYVANLRSLYGNIPLVPHSHWINTECPGAWDLARLDNMARFPQPVETPVETPIEKDWFDMATKDDLKQSLRDVLAEPTVPLRDPSGATGNVTGSTSYETKAEWAAHNDAQILNVAVENGKKLDTLITLLTPKS